MASPEIQFCNVLRRIIIRVIRLPARHTLELASVPVRVVCEPALVTPLRRVPRVHRIHEQSFVLRFVLHEGLQFPKRPFGLPRRERQILADVRQILEDDAIAIVFEGFCNDAVRDGVQNVLDVAFLTTGKLFDGTVCRLCSRLLEVSTRVLELSTHVVEFASVEEASGAGDGYLVDAEVNTENRSVLGRCLCWRVSLHIRLGVDMKSPLAVFAV